jgi:hypothetical protein
VNILMSQKPSVLKAGQIFLICEGISDESNKSLPSGVQMYRNTCQAVYTGELKVQMISELRRRIEVVGNHPRPMGRRWAVGLSVCDECGYFMSRIWRGERQYIVCPCHAGTNVYKRSCSQRKTIRVEMLQATVHKLLE